MYTGRLGRHPGHHGRRAGRAIVAAVSLDERPLPEERVSRPPPPATAAAGRPGDDYNARGDVREVLVRHGWTHVRAVGPNEHWRRPGKDKGVSATIRACNGVDVLYVFSTSTPFEAGQGYSPYQALAILDHGGDYSAAAAALRKAGYGGDMPSLPASFLPTSEEKQVEAVARDDPEDGAPIAIPDTGMFPERLLRVPGYVGELAEYILRK